MKRKSFAVMFWCLVLFVSCSASALAQELKTVQLPQPRMEGGKPLMQALRERKSTREFGPEKLSPEVLSNMLWAAFGINRTSGQRTAPSANNRQEIDIYVSSSDGLFLYEAKANSLKQVIAEDIRALTGSQPFVKDAAVNLIYVADLAKGGRSDVPSQEFYSGANTGFIAQNVYLFCASEGLVTVVRALVDKTALAKAMKLRPDQKITLAQCVGYPKK